MNYKRKRPRKDPRSHMSSFGRGYNITKTDEPKEEICPSPKPHKPKPKFVVEHRWACLTSQPWLASSLEWQPMSKYETEEQAKQAISVLKRTQSKWEYRIRPI